MLHCAVQSKPSLQSHAVPLSREPSTVDDWETSDAASAQLPARAARAATSRDAAASTGAPALPADRK